MIVKKPDGGAEGFLFLPLHVRGGLTPLIAGDPIEPLKRDCTMFPNANASLGACTNGSAAPAYLLKRRRAVAAIAGIRHAHAPVAGSRLLGTGITTAGILANTLPIMSKIAGVAAYPAFAAVPIMSLEQTDPIHTFPAFRII